MTGKAQVQGGRNRWSLFIWGGAGLLLLAPLVAMQFSAGMAWTAFDFAFAGGLLAAVCLGFELVFRSGRNAAYRTAALLAIAAGVLLVLINGAVGIIGSEQEDANLLFGAVVGVALLGALAARFRPMGMAWAMAAAALVQLLVPLAAVALWPATASLVWTPQVLALTGVFTAVWLASAWLFRKAAR
jgi:hypothetical protein